MKRLLLSIALVAFIHPVLAEDATSRLHFKKSGFSIQALDAAPGSQPLQSIFMSLPTEDGFAVNVNVVVKPYAKTMDDYLAMVTEQFKKKKFTVVSLTRPTKSSVLTEYKAEIKGHALHWYARAELVAGKIYLATATTQEAQWPQNSAKMKACVDSLKCDAK